MKGKHTDKKENYSLNNVFWIMNIWRGVCKVLMANFKKIIEQTKPILNAK